MYPSNQEIQNRMQYHRDRAAMNRKAVVIEVVITIGIAAVIWYWG
jgi:hypothetical protein